MSRHGADRDRLILAYLAGEVQFLIHNHVPRDEAIATLQRTAHGRADLLSRTAGHYLARLQLDSHDQVTFAAAVQLLIDAGGTDRELGIRERDEVLERASQAPPSAPTLHKPGGMR